MMNLLTDLRDAVGMAHCRIVLSDSRGGCGYADPDSQTAIIGGQDSDTEYLGVLIHELAHLARRPPLQKPSPLPSQDQMTTVLASIRAPQDRPVIKCIPWFLHGPDFIRLTVHLCWRAQQTGFEVGWGDCRFAGTGYGLSPHWRYARLLGDEPEKLIHLPPWKISAVPMPPEFDDLFRADKVAYGAQLSLYEGTINDSQTGDAHES